MKNLEAAKKKNSVKEKKERRYFTIDARKAIVKEIDLYDEKYPQF